MEEIKVEHDGHVATLILNRPEAMNAPLSPEAISSAHRWLHLWHTPDLATRTTIEWSPRLTRSLGRCYPERRLIRLAAFLEESENALLEEVLCHELAHLAACELHGSNNSRGNRRTVPN